MRMVVAIAIWATLTPLMIASELRTPAKELE